MNNSKFFNKLIIFFLLFLLTGCDLANIAAKQEKATEYLPELTDGLSYGQVFRSERNNLYRVDIGTATFGRDNTKEIVFHLQNNPGDISPLITTILYPEDVHNDKLTTVIFPPIVDSKDKDYYFYIESPNALPGDSYTLLFNEHNTYSYGSAYINHNPVEGDLVFIAYSLESFHLLGVIREFLMRLWHDSLFVFIYFLVIILVASLLILSKFRNINLIK